MHVRFTLQTWYTHATRPLVPCSVAIMKYLVSKYKLPDHWYPSDMKQQAKIDEYLHWHGSNLRMGAGWYLGTKVRLAANISLFKTS